MSGTINTGKLPRLLLEGLRNTFGQTYKEHAVEWDKLMDTMQSKKAYEKDQMVEGFSPAGLKSQGGSIEFDTMAQGYAPEYWNKTYAKGFIVTREMLEDELYGVLNKRARALAFSMRQAQEITAANIYNRAFDTNYTMTNGDGKPLLATDHPLGPTSGGTFSNKLSVGADLSEAAIEDLLIQIGNTVDSRGNKIQIMPERLIVPYDLMFEATRILKSTLQNDTANNAINAIKETGAFQKGMLASHYFTSPDSWFIKTNCPQGLQRFIRRGVEFREDNEFTTENARMKTTSRWSDGWSDPRGLFGSEGTA